MPLAAIVVGIVGLACLLVARRRTVKTVPSKVLASGTPIVVARNHFWAQGATGAVWMPPEGVKHLAPDWLDVARALNTQGRHATYWIVFDEPQSYPEGDGPFIAAELPEAALEPVTAAAGMSPAIKRSEYFGPGELAFSWFENRTSGLRVEFKMKRIVKPTIQ
jgi:hypothetical protein